MPLLGCATSVIIMVGLLGLIGWKVTVISSNFIALMLILNMAMNIHVTVRFLQLKKEFPNLTKEEAVFEASKKINNTSKLRNFSEAGYRFSSSESNDSEMYFFRDELPAK